MAETPRTAKRRPWVWALILAIPLPKTPIAPSAASPRGPTTEMETSSSVDLQVTVVSATPDRLVFRYRARNTWNRDLYLFNRLFETDPTGKQKVDPNRVYVMVEGAVLRASKQLFDVPETVEVEFPEVPYLSKLAAGASLEEEIQLALPARETYPYASSSAQRQPPEKRVCEQFVFTLGYFHARDASWVQTLQVGGQELLATD